MSYFDPKRLASDGKVKYKVSVDASDNHGLITTFYFSIFADNEDNAINKVKDSINSGSYLTGDHLTLDYKVSEMIDL